MRPLLLHLYTPIYITPPSQHIPNLTSSSKKNLSRKTIRSEKRSQFSFGEMRMRILFLRCYIIRMYSGEDDILGDPNSGQLDTIEKGSLHSTMKNTVRISKLWIERRL